MHVSYLAIVLLLEIHKLLSLYGQIGHPYAIHERMFAAAVVVHIVHAAMVGYNYYIWLAHCIICFCVHIIHFGFVYKVFTSLQYSSPEYLFLLTILSFLEMAVNIGYQYSWYADVARITQIFAAVCQVRTMKGAKKQAGGGSKTSACGEVSRVGTSTQKRILPPSKFEKVPNDSFNNETPGDHHSV